MIDKDASNIKRERREKEGSCGIQMLIEGLIEIFDDVVRIFALHSEPDKPGGDIRHS